jgi:TolA-binding protein
MPRARRSLLCLQSLLWVCTSPLLAESLQENSEFRLANQALHDGLPGVAAAKATRLLQQADWNPEDRKILAGFAVESWVRSKNGGSALAILAKDPIAEQPFWTAQAQVLAGKSEQARELLEARLNSGEASRLEQLLLAQILLGHNQSGPARELLQNLSKPANNDIAKRARLMLDELDIQAGNYEVAVKDLTRLTKSDEAHTAELLRARGLLELNLFPQAETSLRHLVTSSGGGERIHHSAAILLAETNLRQGKTTECVESLVQFLDNTQQSQLWSEAFDLLASALEKDSLHSLPPDATLRWITEGNTAQKQSQKPSLNSIQTFRGHAMLLLSRWLLNQDRPLEALGLLEAMIKLHQNHPQAGDAMRLALETYGKLKVDSRVTELAAETRRRFGSAQSAMVDFVSGGTAYARGDFPQATALFQTAANVATTLMERRAALYNAGVTALQMGEIALYQSILGQLEVVSSGSPNSKSVDTSADLELDRALALAAKGQSSAIDEFHAFIEKYSDHPRLAQAQVALAELLLTQIPTDFPAIEAALKAASELPNLTEAQSQQIALTRLWTLDKQGQLKVLTDTGSQFLKTWPESPHAATVRMKVADAFFRLENFANARTEFELVAKESPNSPYTDTALYFAGMAAASMMSDEGRESAINLWQELAERKGPLSIPARQQQALAKRRAGQELEALKLLDSLLTETNLPKDMRRSLTCERAEILMLLGKSDPTQLDKAATSLQQLLREDGLPYLWSSRAGYTLAAVLNAANRTTDALEACYDVVNAKGFTGPANPAEFRWYYRAGFFGIELLESTKEWEAAARLAEKLAQSTGDRANEAKEHGTRIRLEHFLWDNQ